MKTKIFNEDMEYIRSATYIPWNELHHKTILITGGTGLIGVQLIHALQYVSDKDHLHINIIALVRNQQKAEKLFGISAKNTLRFVVGAVEAIPPICEKIDYIIHAASPTASSFFINNPVETIKGSVLGTINLLDLAAENCVKSFVYLSSMEAYGKVDAEVPLTEDMLGFLNPTETRSCYPECKRMCEALCNAYAKEYALHASAIRLAQTFGPSVAYDDQRIFAMMARCAIERQDIVLQTKGNSKHTYIYTAQAVTAILTVLLKGKAGSVYNVANPKTYSSIYEMGQMVANEIAAGEIQVKIAAQGDTSKYPAPSFLNLDINAIQALGWSPSGNLQQMYERMIEQMRISIVHQ